MRKHPASTLAEWRENGELAPIASRAFWRWATLAPTEGVDAMQLLPADERKLFEEYRVLGKASSGGGFLVPSDLAEQIATAARAGSAVAQVAQEFRTERGETLGVALAGTHGTAAWVAESGSYTPSDETITQQNLGAFKGTSKIIVSEELRADEAVSLDDYLAGELGARIGALANSAMTVGDGSGKPLGLVHASSPYTVVNAATGSTTSFKLADLKTVWKSLPAAYRPTSTWMLHADDFGELAALADSAGGLILPSLQLDPPSLFGRPVVLNADLPTPAASAKSLLLADFKVADGVRRVNGIGIQRQDELHSDNGQVGYRAFFRVDGRPLLADAARILAHSAT
jgi:HK97 family phage major capsid protein